MSDISATVLIDQLRKGKSLHDQFAAEFRSKYKVAGKLMDEWKNHFRIILPPDLNPETCRLVDSKLIELHQEASFLKAEAEARLSAQRNVNEKQYRVRYAELVAEYKSSNQKLPAKDTLATLTNNSISEIVDAITHAEIEVGFWKEVLADLYNSRKVVNDATINLSVEAKALQNDRFLDSLSFPRSTNGRI